MQKNEIKDTAEALESHNPIPKGWLAFFILIILWGLWYIYTYTPEVTGWSQYKILEKELATIKKTTFTVLHENPYKNNDKAIAEGKVIYLEYCAMCHGEDLRGTVGGTDLTAHLNYGETDDKKFESIANGRGGGMPAFVDQLGTDRIWKVLAYIDSVRE